MPKFIITPEEYQKAISFLYKTHIIRRQKIREALYLSLFWRIEDKYASSNLMLCNYHAGLARLIFKPHLMGWFDKIRSKYNEYFRINKKYISIFFAT